MARDRARLVQAFPDGYEIAAGDATRARDLDAALDGCHGVHVSVAHLAEEAAVAKKVADAARRHGTKRISYVSGTSVVEDNAWYPMVAAKLRAEAALKDSGAAWTIFRPTWFMEALPNFLKHGRAVCFGRGDTRLHFGYAFTGSAQSRGLVNRGGFSRDSQEDTKTGS